MNTYQHYIRRMQSQAPFLQEEMFSFLFSVLGTVFQLEEIFKCKHKETKKYNRDTIMKMKNMDSLGWKKLGEVKKTKTLKK